MHIDIVIVLDDNQVSRERFPSFPLGQICLIGKLSTQTTTVISHQQDNTASSLILSSSYKALFS